MNQIFSEIWRELKEGRDCLLMTIVESSGSVPRGSGSRMLLRCREDGGPEFSGTIGGGAVEYQAQLAAEQAFREKRSFLREFTLTRGQAADIGMVCGGDVTVFFQYIPAGDAPMRELCRGIMQKEEEGLDCRLSVRIETDGSWKAELLDRNPEEKCGLWKMEDHMVYREMLLHSSTVYIFGCGHVAQELTPLLAHLGFSCVVMDDRPEFADKALFPDAKKVIVGDLRHIGESVSIGSGDCVCIMTRGHEYDYYVQKQVMPLHPRYIGIMGSRNKIQVVTEKLLADGFSLEEIKACHMPIGTAISAETPAEIAVSIAGELILTRARAEGREKQKNI